MPGSRLKGEWMTFRHRLLIGLLLGANLIVVGYLINSRQDSKTQAEPVTVKKTQRLPSLKLLDDGGKEFDTGELIGNPIFVQFINPHVPAQVDSYTRVRTQQWKQPVSWLLISKDAGVLRRQLPPGNNDFIVENRYDELRELFGVQKCCEEWLIFDKTGTLKDTGKYDEDVTGGRLKRLVEDEVPYSTNVLFEALVSVNNKGSLKQVHTKAARSQSGKAVVVLLSNACTGCSEDHLIDTLRTMAIKSPEVAFLALLPNTFTNTDVDIFKTNFEVPFAVELAGEDLSREWLLINDKYGWKTVNGTVFVVSGGKIISLVNGLQETKDLLKGLAKKI